MKQQQQSLFKGAPKSKPIKGDGRSESSHQQRFIAWCRDSVRFQADPLRKEALRWLHSVPNGSFVHRTGAEFKGREKAPRQALKLIAEGLTAGVWDLRLDYVLRDSTGTVNCPGLIIEMKMPGKYLSKEQQDYLDFMHGQGFRCVLARSWQEAARCVIEYMSLKHHAPIYDWS